MIVIFGRPEELEIVNMESDILMKWKFDLISWLLGYGIGIYLAIALITRHPILLISIMIGATIFFIYVIRQLLSVR